jgi:MFS family permease
VLWTATVVANIGTWMYNASSGWLMTSLNPDPFIVSMVQVATTLPMFLFALPAGALADIIDKRKLLIIAEAAIFAGIVWLDVTTPGNLLLFTFLIGAAGALTAPAWQSIVPQLVPKQDLQPAVAANSVGFNVSRAVGPALGGLIVASIGIAAPFWLNAVSNLGIVGALLWWRSPRTSTIRPAPPVCAPLEIERRGPRRSLLVLRHRSETRRSRPLWFAQGALRFGGPSAPTCTQQKGRREGESRGRPGTIVRCRLFPEPRCESPQSAVYTESTLPAYLRTAFAPRFFDRAADFIQRERPSLRHESELA